jgi:hypothetical protein
MRVAREAIKLRDDENGIVKPAYRQGFGKLRSIIARAAFDFNVLADQFPTTAIEKASDRAALRFKAQTGMTLPRGRNPQVRYEYSLSHALIRLRYVLTNRRSIQCNGFGFCFKNKLGVR